VRVARAEESLIVWHLATNEAGSHEPASFVCALWTRRNRKPGKDWGSEESAARTRQVEELTLPDAPGGDPGAHCQVINPRTADDTPARACWGNLGQNQAKNYFVNIFKNNKIQDISEISFSI
jgi:hypothetical protein